ncbi:uncharacterized protein LOC120264776 isoform X2 [Dioscorea cayenensis subsp. rotundata]|uniref:Uncharacterized protein LOC120264776 isoform X2 n=1 Tax=Dioscorea cayennensis subsp. rotundata TaxID=55577 RepID=A0AB40BMH4_DIOCR|nr:uncharacterized protein LOC120264776 isoform X2 [Dioscorea cayenensis subsp. rotundata]
MVRVLFVFNSFGRWEADPLFSAAEVVQDSADRMESVFQMLLHEQKLVQGESSDSKLLGQIQYHRRDLLTALETTKWQDKYLCSHLGIFPISNILQFIHSHRWVEAFRRRVQRTRYDMLHYRCPTRLVSAILITLAVLGFLKFYIM